MRRACIVDVYFSEELAKLGVHHSFIQESLRDVDEITKHIGLERNVSSGRVDAKTVYNAAEFTADAFNPTTVAEAYFKEEFKRLKVNAPEFELRRSIETLDFPQSPLCRALQIPFEWQQFMGLRRTISVSELVREEKYALAMLGAAPRQSMEGALRTEHLRFTCEAHLTTLRLQHDDLGPNRTCDHLTSRFRSHPSILENDENDDSRSVGADPEDEARDILEVDSDFF